MEETYVFSNLGGKNLFLSDVTTLSNQIYVNVLLVVRVKSFRNSS